MWRSMHERSGWYAEVFAESTRTLATDVVGVYVVSIRGRSDRSYRGRSHALSIRYPRIVVHLSLSLVGVVLAPSPGYGEEDQESAESTGNSGVSNAEAPPLELTRHQRSELAEKDQKFTALAKALRSDTGATRSVAPSLIPPTEPNGGKYRIPAATNMTIHRQQKGYTCGPAPLRNMVLVMNKVNKGTYSAASEATLEDWLGTTTSGTGISMINYVLNDRYSRFGSWSLRDPADREAYLAIVAVDTYEYKQPVVQGVRTGYMDYWNGKYLNHFNDAYGWDSTNDVRWIHMLEVFDPVHLYGYRPSYGNPYGHRKATLAQAFKANDVSNAAASDRRRIIA